MAVSERTTSEQVVADRRDEYMRRVDETRFLYDQELRFGTFENVWNGGYAPLRRGR
jgi:hypothetical protein